MVQTYLAPHGQIYVAHEPMSPNDIVIPNRPEDMSIHAMFDKERGENGEWFDPMTDVVFLKKEKLKEVLVKYQHCFEYLNLIYPPAEREGWSLQKEEAEAYLANNSTPTPMLSALVAMRGRGETVEQFAQNVLGHSAEFKQLYAWFTGQQQRKYAEVVALEEYEAIKAYEVVYDLPPSA